MKSLQSFPVSGPEDLTRANGVRPVAPILSQLAGPGGRYRVATYGTPTTPPRAGSRERAPPSRVSAPQLKAADQSFIYVGREQGPLWHDEALLLLHGVEQAANAHHDEEAPTVSAAGTVLPLQ